MYPPKRLSISIDNDHFSSYIDVILGSANFPLARERKVAKVTESAGSDFFSTRSSRQIVLSHPNLSTIVAVGPSCAIFLEEHFD